MSILIFRSYCTLRCTLQISLRRLLLMGKSNNYSVWACYYNYLIILIIGSGSLLIILSNILMEYIKYKNSEIIQRSSFRIDTLNTCRLKKDFQSATICNDLRRFSKIYNLNATVCVTIDVE